jgi:YHS domain-containing protein/thiol-disulfide isomerase/thioredoxin
MSSLSVWCLAGVLAFGPAVPAPPVIWQANYDLALAEANLTGRPLLVHVTASWCAACKRLERSTLSDPSTIDLVNRSFVAVRVDADASPKLAKRLGAKRLPVGLVISPAGDILGRIEGYRPTAEYTSELRQVLDHHRMALARRSTQPPATASRSPQVRLSVAHQPTSHSEGTVRLLGHTEIEPASHGTVLLGLQLDPCLSLDGYCPVSLLEEKLLASGRPEYSAEHEGKTYWFSSPENQEKFCANPQRYLPVLQGFCVASYIHSGEKVSGDPRYGAVYRGRLYLFAGAEERRQFQEQPKPYAAKVHASF